MRNKVRQLVHRGLELSGLIGPLFRRQEQRIAELPTPDFEDGRPMPPADLMVAVSGTPAQAWFSERGRADAARFTGFARAHGLDTAGPIDVLDFGCGCGRIARWLAPDITAAGGRFYGSDINPRLIAWCSGHLPGRYFRNRLRPPLALPDAAVDLIYAHSVLTHLREKAARAWLKELARTLRPGGLAILSFHDETYAEAWGPPEVRPQMSRQGYFVLNDALEGSNYMSAWTTRAYFTELAAPIFEVLEIVPGGRDAPEQAVAVLKRRGA